LEVLLEFLKEGEATEAEVEEKYKEILAISMILSSEQLWINLKIC
jgi:hypothetical protein